MEKNKNYKTPLPKDVKYYLDKLKKTWNIVNYERRLFVEFIEDIFANEELIYDEQKIEKYFSYEKYFNYGQKTFKLVDWERCLFVLHYCTFRKDGFPRFPDLFILSGRGTGKNGFLAFEAFCGISPLHNIQEYDISFCSVSEDNAKTSFEEIYNLLENADKKNETILKKYFRWTLTRITCLKTNSKITYKTSNATTKDGGKEGQIAFDEYHQYTNYALINVFTTGLGKKPNPRSSIFTTDGYVRGGPLDETKEKALMVLKKEMPDNGFLPFICKLDDEKEVKDITMWNKANPSLEFFPVLLEEIKKEYVNYCINPIANFDFIVKRMNIPKIKTENPVTSWDNIYATWKLKDDAGNEYEREIPDLKGMKCVCGIDYTRRNDFLGICLTFYIKGIYYSIKHSWVCKQSDDWNRFNTNIDIYSWESAGLLTIVDDVELRPSLVVDWIREKRKDYKIVKLAMDSYRYDFLSSELEKIGYSKDSKQIYLVRPSDIMRINEKIGTAFVRHLIVWGNDPLMRWATNNTKLIPTKNNNYTYDKIEPKSRKTDPFMAFVHSMVVVDELEKVNINNMPRLKVVGR